MVKNKVLLFVSGGVLFIGSLIIINQIIFLRINDEQSPLTSAVTLEKENGTTTGNQSFVDEASPQPVPVATKVLERRKNKQKQKEKAPEVKPSGVFPG